MAWYKLEADEEGKLFAAYFEIHDDHATRQIERYGDCWVYSGDSSSYCPREDFDAHGELTKEAFSSFSDLPLAAISEQEFESAWQQAQANARPKTDKPR